MDNESQSLVDYSIVDQEFMAVLPMVFQYMASTSSAGGDQAYAKKPCAALTYESGDTLQMKDVDYTFDVYDNHCITHDTKERTGIMQIRLNSQFSDDGSRSVVRFKNYISDDWSYDADSIIITRIGTGGSHIAFNVQVINGRANKDTYHLQYSCERTVAVFPATNASGLGAYISFYGDARGHSRTGLDYKVEVIKDVMKPHGCRYFNSGLIEITPQGFKPRKVDFGDGTCDGQATFEVNENSVAFKLK